MPTDVPLPLTAIRSLDSTTFAAAEPTPPAVEAGGDGEADYLVPLVIEADPDEVLGGGEWQPELRLVLDEDGAATLTAGEHRSSDNGVLYTVWIGRDREWTHRYGAGSRVVADPGRVGDMARRLRPLLDRVHRGRSINWDGRNMRGTLNDDACAAEHAISAIMNECWDDVSRTLSDAEVWLAASRGRTVSADTTDAEVAIPAADLKMTARAHGHVLDGDVADVLKGWRDKLAQEQENEDTGVTV